MDEIIKFRKKYNTEALSAEKATLEERLNNAHKTKENISQLNSQHHYTSLLLEKLIKLDKQFDAYNQANSMLENECDLEMIDLARSEKAELEEKIQDLYQEVFKMEVEKEFSDPDDDRSVILEIRAGAGGEEAALFAADLFRMYSLYSKNQGWEVAVIDTSVSENGGYKEVIANITGKNAYKHLKNESGVHRVQRVPVTESSGRIHTSTASVAILPEVEEIDISIDPSELRIDVMRASGPGGQSVNKTDSAVRITHLPTNIVVSCQETKYQNQNKEKAMNILRAKLYEKKKQEEAQKRSDMRSGQIGTSMRAEKIRTYNFPQTRVTDHRIKQSWFNIDTIMSGGIDDIVSDVSDGLIKQQLEKKMQRNDK